VTEYQRAEVTKELIRAQDALHNAFQIVARCDGQLDLAADLRKRRVALGDTITKVNGGPVKVRATELLGSFR
jgi:hypothetical protein